MPDTNTRWILGTLAVLAGLILQQGAAMTGRLDRLDNRLERLEDRVQSLDDRLRAVEVAFGKVDQRLETIERTVLPTPAD